MVAGGGASVIYADTIVDLGGVQELANYGKFRRFHISQLISRQINYLGIYSQFFIKTILM